MKGGATIEEQMNISIGNRLKKLRLDNGFSRKEVSKRLNIHETTLKRYEDGDIKKLSLDTFKVLASFYNVEPYDIIGLENLTTDQNSLNKIEKTRVPNQTKEKQTPIQSITVYGKVCAGNGIEAFEDPIDEITNPYHRIKGEMFSLQVDGDSMNNVVNDGMYAIIQKQSIVKNGEIAVVLIDNEVGMLKRFFQLDESTVVLKPDSTNFEHKSIIFEGNEINRLKILGRYLGHVSPMEKLL